MPRVRACPRTGDTGDSRPGPDFLPPELYMNRAFWAHHRGSTLGRDVVDRLATDGVYRSRMRRLLGYAKDAKPRKRKAK